MKDIEKRLELIVSDVAKLKSIISKFDEKQFTRDDIINKRTIIKGKHGSGFRGVNRLVTTSGRIVFQARARRYIGTYGSFEEAKEAVIDECLTRGFL